MLLDMKPRFLHLAGWFAIILISLDLGIFKIPHTSPRLITLDDILSGWDAQVIRGVSNLLSVWGCETFYQVPGFNYRNNGEIRSFVSPSFPAVAIVFGLLALVASDFRLGVLHFFLAFKCIPVGFSHFEESCNSQVLPIASRKREPLRPQK